MVSVKVLFVGLLVFCYSILPAYASSYCERHMPSIYQQCMHALNQGSDLSIGNWHISLLRVRSSSDVQDQAKNYAYAVSTNDDVYLALSCKQGREGKKGLSLHATVPFIGKGDLWYGIEGQPLRKATWTAMENGGALIQDGRFLMDMATKTDTLLLKYSTAPNLNVEARFHTLKSTQMLNRMNCKK